MRYLMLVPCVFGAFSAANAAAILNGSFEIGVNPNPPPYGSILLAGGNTTAIANWKVTGNNIDYVGNAWQAADGLRSLDLSGIAPGGVEQTVHGLVVGTQYLLTFDLSGSYSGVRTSPNRMVVSATGNAAQTYSFGLNNTVADMMYQAESYAFTATNAITVVKLNGLDRSNYGAVLDNVALAVAPPTTRFTTFSRSFSKFGEGPTVAVPEPAAWALLIAGFAMTGAAMRRRTNVVTA